MKHVIRSIASAMALLVVCFMLPVSPVLAAGTFSLSADTGRNPAVLELTYHGETALGGADLVVTLSGDLRFAESAGQLGSNGDNAEWSASDQTARITVLSIREEGMSGTLARIPVQVGADGGRVTFELEDAYDTTPIGVTSDMTLAGQTLTLGGSGGAPQPPTTKAATPTPTPEPTTPSTTTTTTTTTTTSAAPTETVAPTATPQPTTESSEPASADRLTTEAPSNETTEPASSDTTTTGPSTRESAETPASTASPETETGMTESSEPASATADPAAASTLPTEPDASIASESTTDETEALIIAPHDDWSNKDVAERRSGFSLENVLRVIIIVLATASVVALVVLLLQNRRRR